MKKLFLMVLTVLGLSFIALAQGGETGGGLEGTFDTLATMVAGVVAATEILKNLFNTQGGWGTRILSWGTGIVVSLVGWVLDYGILAEVAWWGMALIGLGSSLAANGLADTGLIDTILRGIGLYSKKLKH